MPNDWPNSMGRAFTCCMSWKTRFCTPRRRRPSIASHLKRLRGLSCANTEVALTSGRAFAAIIEYAQNAGCDLIVVASHGRGAAAHMLLGSVAENILRTAHCPVYVVRQKAHEHVDI
jgi:nucleotide-binding universal stress UspA family protein